ncbi:right-handed parallel beta-helix repeat-containing protein [bacterium]|nr:right-handed parallel beta-helix repeat-containing protein [bacterium]
MKKNITIACLLLAFVLNQAKATKLLVDATSSNYTTISAAISAATSGDTIIVYPGTYSGFSSSAAKSLTIIGTNPLGTDGAVGTSGSTTISSGITLNNSSSTFRIMNCYIPANITITAASGVFNYNVVSGTLGISISSSFDVLGNYFNNGSANGIDASGSNITIASNIVQTSTSSSYYGISISGNNNLVANNSVFKYYYGIYITSSTNSLVLNNIGYNSAGYAIYCNVSSQTNVIANNCYYSGQGNYIYPASQNGGGNLSNVNPLFTTFSTSFGWGTTDLTLQPSSPCINSGNALLTDVDGSASDMGIYGGISPFDKNFIVFLPKITSLGVTPVIVAPNGDVTVTGTAQTVGQ